jgi:hypothetical protein
MLSMKSSRYDKVKNESSVRSAASTLLLGEFNLIRLLVHLPKKKRVFSIQAIELSITQLVAITITDWQP